MAEFGIGSDYKTIITFIADGAIIDATGVGAPEHFDLDFYTTNQTLKKTASKVDSTYTNCEVINDGGVYKLAVSIDDVSWGEGDVICKATMHFPDLQFVDDERTVVSYLETGDSYVRL